MFILSSTLTTSWIFQVLLQDPIIIKDNDNGRLTPGCMYMYKENVVLCDIEERLLISKIACTPCKF